MGSILQNRFLNGWWLFSLIALPITGIVISRMLQTDLSAGPGVSEMIGLSVRLAIPFIYLAMAASAFQVLWPGAFGKWWLRNRRYIGLCFAVGMFWQGVFIFIISTVYRDYYYSDVYYFRDELEGTFGYVFLAAMVLTSFRFTRKHLDQAQWKLIQKGGIYALWGYAFSVYWWNLSYYGNPEAHDYVYYWAGFAAFAIRIAAWGKQRRLRAEKQGAAAPGLASRWAGIGLIASGLLLSATGLQWQDPVTTFLTSPAWSAELVLWLPFWPFEPFLPLMLIGLGVAAMTYTGKRAESLSMATGAGRA
ncbi:MAG: hypothetical protein AAGI11_19775 [Pseudomonadota bacterium]